jgi:hypothetical protein
MEIFAGSPALPAQKMVGVSTKEPTACVVAIDVGIIFPREALELALSDDWFARTPSKGNLNPKEHGNKNSKSTSAFPSMMLRVGTDCTSELLTAVNIDGVAFHLAKLKTPPEMGIS